MTLLFARKYDLRVFTGGGKQGTFKRFRLYLLVQNGLILSLFMSSGFYAKSGRFSVQPKICRSFICRHAWMSDLR